MKNFINFLKGLAVVAHFSFIGLTFPASFYCFYAACVYTGTTAAIYLAAGAFTLIIGIILTMTRGLKFFPSVFPPLPSKREKAASANKGKKNF